MSVPVRHVVELRPPRKGERYVDSLARVSAPVEYDYGQGTLCWVIVDTEQATEADSAAPVCPVEPRTGPDTTRTAEEPE